MVFDVFYVLRYVWVLNMCYLDIIILNEVVLLFLFFLCNWIVCVDKCILKIVNISIYYLNVIGC